MIAERRDSERPRPETGVARARSRDRKPRRGPSPRRIRRLADQRTPRPYLCRSRQYRPAGRRGVPALRRARLGKSMDEHETRSCFRRADAKRRRRRHLPSRPPADCGGSCHHPLTARRREGPQHERGRTGAASKMGLGQFGGSGEIFPDFARPGMFTPGKASKTKFPRIPIAWNDTRRSAATPRRSCERSTTIERPRLYYLQCEGASQELADRRLRLANAKRTYRPRRDAV